MCKEDDYSPSALCNSSKVVYITRETNKLQGNEDVAGEIFD